MYMRTAIAIIASLLITPATYAQVYINDGVFIPAEGAIHSNEEIRLSDAATVYNEGRIQSHQEVLVSGNNFIWMGGDARVMTTIPDAQASWLAVGVNSNNRMILQQSSGQAQAYMVGLRGQVYQNPGTGGSTVPSGIANRTWSIEPLWHTGNTDITLGWNAAEEININRDSIAITSWKHATNTKWTRNGHAPATNTGSNPAYERTMSLNMDMGNVYYLHITDTTTPTGIKGLNTSKTALAFNVYPNPANNMVHYAVSSNVANYQLLLHDVTGKLITVRQHTAPNTSNGSIDISALAGGIYTLTLRTEDGHAETKRLLVSHQ